MITKAKMDVPTTRLLHTMKACIENGNRLYHDAEWLGTDSSPTIVALCILAQEEFAKAFIIHLVREGIIPWTTKVRESLHNHKLKQLIGLIMEWLSPSDDEYISRIGKLLEGNTVPTYVVDAMKSYIKKVQPQAHSSYPPATNDPRTMSVADGDRDKIKQDAIYVRIAEDGEAISIPSQFLPEIAEEELEITKRLGDLVRPLQQGERCWAFDYNLLLEAMKFLLKDKSGRPFLVLKESTFGGAVHSANGITWPHCIRATIENISNEEANCYSGHASIFLDNTITKPSFTIAPFLADPYTAYCYTFMVSEETYALGASSSHKLELYINLDYKGADSDCKYNIRMWSIYDPKIGAFRETLTDSQESMNGMLQPQRELETKWSCQNTKNTQ